jgi:sec-independent protein translocase protein TatA
VSGIGAPEILLVFLVLLLMFGARKLPQLARSMGQAGKEFKSGLKEGYVEQPVEGACPFCGVDVPADSKFCPGCAKSADEIIAARAKATA